MKLLKKAYLVFDKKDVFELGMPWVVQEYIKVSPDESASKAKLKAMWCFDCDFIDLRARRRKEDDIYLFEGREMSKHMIDYHIEHRDWKNKMEKLVQENKGAKVYIRSGQWASYWRANGAGYTNKISDVGIYDIEDAWKRTAHCGLEKQISFEFVKVQDLALAS